MGRDVGRKGGVDSGKPGKGLSVRRENVSGVPDGRELALGGGDRGVGVGGTFLGRV